MALNTLQCCTIITNYKLPVSLTPFFFPLLRLYIYTGLVAVYSLVAQTVKDLPEMWETWIWSLGWEDPLEKEMDTHFSIPPREFHGQRSLAGFSPWNCKESNRTEWLSHIIYTHVIYITYRTVTMYIIYIKYAGNDFCFVYSVYFFFRVCIFILLKALKLPLWLLT